MQLIVRYDMRECDKSIFQNNQDTWDITYLAEHEVPGCW